MSGNLAQTLMEEFADATGVSRAAPPRRYLWTDAFAVCNFLGLYRKTGAGHFLGLARNLIDQVHHLLGRHRPDDPRQGWISGLPAKEGEQHPTRGGLRIGKRLNELGPHQRPDDRLEWERDGQYFHYLTKWMHALCRTGQETEESRYQRWALELAAIAHEAFAHERYRNGPKQMAWKMSIDLSRPLVSSMGQHDPLGGLITCLELQTTPGLAVAGGPDLTVAIAEMTEMCSQSHWTTEDPLGIGGLLDDATRLAQLVFVRKVERRKLLHRLLIEIETSLVVFGRSTLLNRSADRRLAFRELGLSIGLHGLRWIKTLVERDCELSAACHRILPYSQFAEQIQTFWSDPAYRLSSSWMDHRDINTVMLATSLAPESYLQVLSPRETNQDGRWGG
jgi:hypothetical protein